jgi:hypothetical protein
MIKMKKSGKTPKIGTFKLSQLKPAAYNPRTINDEALAGLAASIARFGCVEPIVVNVHGKKNTIIGGHQRYKVLLDMHGKDHRCPCVTVDLKKTEEKALNLTLNNPALQGEFVEGLGRYIEQLRDELSDEELFLDLKMDRIRSEFGTDNKCQYKEENLKPYKKTHVLLSFAPHVLPKIADQLRTIIKVDEVEYEQCSN